MQQTNSSQLLYDNIVTFLTKKGTKKWKKQNKKTTFRHNVKDDLNNIVGWTEKHNASACICACLWASVEYPGRAGKEANGHGKISDSVAPCQYPVCWKSVFVCVCMHKLEQRALQDKCVFLCGESRGPVHTASLPTSSCANQAKTERFFLQGNKQSAHSVLAGEP